MKKLSHYRIFLDPLLQTLTDKVEFTSEPPLEDILRNPRLVITFNHSTPLSWLPAIALLNQQACLNGGDERVPRGVADHWFYSNPFTQWIAEQLTQSSKPQTFNELVTNFSESYWHDLVVFPEGAHTFFGNVKEIGEFRSPKFVEIAIRCAAPILLCVHKGSESWSQSIPVSHQLGGMVLSMSKFFGENLMKTGAINLPMPPSKIPIFKMKCALYMPALYESDLSENENERRNQLSEEAEKIRNKMIEMLGSL